MLGMPRRVDAGDAEVRAPLLTGSPAESDSDEGTTSGSPLPNCTVISDHYDGMFHPDKSPTFLFVCFYIFGKLSGVIETAYT